MSFADTYRQEVHASRRDRSRRALFWAKIVSLLLMITVAAILRAEPELRRQLAGAGMDAVGRVMQLPAGQNAPSGAPARITWKPQKTDNPAGAKPLTPQIKVNRYGATRPAEAINLEQRIGPAPVAIRP